MKKNSLFKILTSLSLMFSGQIKYKIVYYPDPDSDTQKTINISTSQMAKSTVVTIV